MSVYNNDCFSGKSKAAETHCSQNIISNEIRNKSEKNTSNPLDELFKSISDEGFDKDRLILIGLLYLLVKEGADKTLILALGYILL